MLSSRYEAEKILCDGESGSPGAWASHSRITARTAEIIAIHSGSLDSEKAYILGLLHNIGRSFGESQMRHIYDGYRYMLSLGYDEVAGVASPIPSTAKGLMIMSGLATSLLRRKKSFWKHF